MKPCRANGFTLIEVIAALAIISLGLLAAIQAVTQTVSNASYLREKTIAHWVALNQITTVRVANAAPTAGETEGDVEMAGTLWHWRMNISATDMRSMLRIDVNVAPKDAGKDVSIASASGFYGRAITMNGARMQWDASATPGVANSGASSSSASSSSSAGT